MSSPATRRLQSTSEHPVGNEGGPSHFKAEAVNGGEFLQRLLLEVPAQELDLVYSE